jgi:uncharacterized protein YutE (UPF0331/DUF86 family)
MDTTPIAARLGIIANCVNALKALQNLTYDEFVSDHIVRSAVERNFQVAVQAALDIASMILADSNVDIPQAYADLFPALAEIGVIPGDFSEKLVYMAKFRNVLVHMYLDVAPKRLYAYLQDNLDDLEQYTRYIGDYLAPDLL